MTKPIGWFISNDSDIKPLNAIAQTQGDRLEKLNWAEKLTLLQFAVDTLSAREDYSALPTELEDQIDSLSTDGILSLTAAVVEQLRHTQ